MVTFRRVERDLNKHMLTKIGRMTPRSKESAMMAFVKRINNKGEGEAEPELEVEHYSDQEVSETPDCVITPE